MICLFLAILELVKRRNVELVQGEAFGDIGLRRDLNLVRMVKRLRAMLRSNRNIADEHGSS